jgi:quinol monooxygenase YgiN
MVQHKVKNFAKWKSAYMAHDSMRQAYGISHFQIGRSMDDSNMVIVIDKITDVKKAKDFAASAGLKAAMQKAGVSGAPAISYSDVVRNDASVIDQKDRVMVAHKVKDFDAWLKVYDAEGMKSRMENGVIDRGLARDADDPNMIYIVFAIADMAKAKARIGSEELKKLMMDAGVEGAPKITYYRLVD